MSKRESVLVVVSAVVAVVGLACRSNPDHCLGHPGDNCMNLPDASDAPQSCASDEQCSGAMPVCDVSGSKTCVQCTPAEATQCMGMTPVCGSGDSCRGCVAHSECMSDACLPDGSCSTGSDVAYVDPAGSGSACTQAAPCEDVVAALATGRPFVKFTGATVGSGVTVTDQERDVPGGPWCDAVTRVLRGCDPDG